MSVELVILLFKSVVKYKLLSDAFICSDLQLLFKVQISLDMSCTIMSASQVQSRQYQRKGMMFSRNKQKLFALLEWRRNSDVPMWDKTKMLPRKTSF